jgi:hypothetical protein
LRSANLLSERHRLQIANAAQWLCARDRDKFWQAVARELHHCELNDAGVERAVAVAFGAFYRPVGILD